MDDADKVYAIHRYLESEGFEVVSVSRVGDRLVIQLPRGSSKGDVTEAYSLASDYARRLDAPPPVKLTPDEALQDAKNNLNRYLLRLVLSRVHKLSDHEIERLSF